mgnify:CR=1 FL=1
MTTLGTPLSPSATKVMLLGSGELGKEVLIALQRLGVETIAVDRYDNAPGQQVAHHARTIAMSAPAMLRALIEEDLPDLVVPEIEAIATGMHPVVQQLQTSVLGSLLCLPVMVWANGTGIVELDPVMPQGYNWLWLFGVGFWAAASHLCMTIALKFAPASTLAPLHYLEIVTAVAIGYLVFGDFPNALTWAGIIIIVASGLYIIHRERITLRQARSVLPEVI